MAFENLTIYTEVDSAGDLTVDSTSVVFDTMRRDAVSYVYKDFGAGYFADFTINFEAKIDSLSGNQAMSMVFCLSNTVGTLQDFVDNNDGMLLFIWNNSDDLTFSLRDYNTDNSDNYDIVSTSSSSLLYFTLSRSDTTLTLDIYSDSSRTILVDSLTLTCETGDKRYLYTLAARDDTENYPDSVITGYAQNFEILENSSSSISSSSSTSSSSTSSSSSSSFSAALNTQFVGQDTDVGYGTSRTLDLPPGTVEHDFMITSIWLETTSGYVMNVIPSGWTQLYRMIASGLSTKYVYYKFATDSEPANYTWGWTQSLEAITGVASYRGVDLSDPIADFGYSNGSGTTITAPSVTTEEFYSMVVWTGDSRYGIVMVDPVGYTQRYNVRNGTGSGNNAGILSDLVYSAKGATGSKSAVQPQSDIWVGTHIALNVQNEGSSSSSSSSSSSASSSSLSSSSSSSSSESSSSSSSSNALTSWAHSFEGYVESDRLSGTLTNFPIPIEISTSAGINNDDLLNFFQNLQSYSNRKKVAFTDENGIFLYAEIESFDVSNRKAFFHVKFPTVSSSTDTKFYIYYDRNQADNPYIGDTDDVVVQNIWDSFKYVCHFNTPTFIDSAAGATARIEGNNVDIVDADFGKAATFNDATSGIIVYQSPSFDPSDLLTTDTRGTKWDEITSPTLTANGGRIYYGKTSRYASNQMYDLDGITFDLSGLTLSQNNLAAFQGAGLITNYVLSGDFEVTVDMTDVSWGSAFTGSHVGINGIAVNSRANRNLAQINYQRKTTSTTGYTWLNGVSNTNSEGGTCLGFRMLRSGTTITLYRWDGSAWNQVHTRSSSNAAWVGPWYFSFIIQRSNSTPNNRVSVFYDWNVLSGTTIYGCPPSLFLRDANDNETLQERTVELYHKPDALSGVIASKSWGMLSTDNSYQVEFRFDYTGSLMRVAGFPEGGSGYFGATTDPGDTPAPGIYRYNSFRGEIYNSFGQTRGWHYYDHATVAKSVGWSTSYQNRRNNAPLVIGGELRTDLNGIEEYVNNFNGDVSELRIASKDLGTTWMAATEYGLEDDLVYYSGFEGSSSSSLSSSSRSSSSSSNSSSSSSSSAETSSSSSSSSLSSSSSSSSLSSSSSSSSLSSSSSSLSSSSLSSSSSSSSLSSSSLSSSSSSESSSSTSLTPTSLSPDADTYIEFLTTTNYSNSEIIKVGAWKSGSKSQQHNGLLSFDVSELPIASSLEIIGAELRLLSKQLLKGGRILVDAKRVKREWSETKSNFKQYTYDSTSFQWWEKIGCYGDEDRQLQRLSSKWVLPPDSTGETWCSWGVASAVRTAFDSGTNCKIILQRRWRHPSSGIWSFYSSEESDVSKKPYLIVYTV